MQKTQKYHHSVTENGNIQVRLLTEYKDDTGKVILKKYNEPMTPVDTNDMTGWDQKSKDIVTAITSKAVKYVFDIEKKPPIGVGLEEIITYDRTIDDLCRISVRRITRIYDEGVEVSKKYHRSWIIPGDETKDFDVINKAIANKLHTKAVIDIYNTKIAEMTLS